MATFPPAGTWNTWVSAAIPPGNVYVGNSATIGTTTVWNGWVVTNTNITTGGGYDPWPQWQGTGYAFQQPPTYQPPGWYLWNDSVNLDLYRAVECNRPLTREQAYSCKENVRPLTRAQHVAEVQEQYRRECEQRRRATINANRARSRALRMKAAEKRAELLLVEQLNEEQRTEWREGRAFHVHTADGRRTYKIAYGLSHNVKVVKTTDDAPRARGTVKLKVGASLCAHVYHPDGPIPNCDNVLAQKLLLEADEASFVQMAYAGNVR